MNCNVGGKDRIIRIVLGVLILGGHYGYYAMGGEYCIWANIGFIPLLTGIFKFCPLYLLLGKSTACDEVVKDGD